MEAKPQKEHDWLEKLVGSWTYEGDCNMGPDQAPMKSSGREVTRSIGGLWVVCEGEMEMPGGGIGQTIMTLGFDPQQDRYVGTYIGSMMSYLWVYNGSLDSSGKVLTLDTEGMNLMQNSMTKYKDIIEFTDDDHRTLSSQILMDDGSWFHFMTARYTRVK